MALYRINHPATGRVVNLYISSSTGSVPPGTPLSLYPWQNNSDQKFEMEYRGDYVIFRLQRDTSQVINRNASNNQAMVWPFSTDQATLNDSLINTETEGGNMRIKLVHQGLYLTKDSSSNMLYWQPKAATNRQYFTLQQVAGDPGGDTGTGGGQGPYGDYVYPTVCRQYSQAYSFGHPALDIRDLAQDHNVYAMSDGIVAYTQNSSGSWNPGTPEGEAQSGKLASMGNCIAINHMNPFNGHSDGRTGAYARSIYMHMATNPTVKPGDTVKKGQILGTIGDTGVSSGNHLHFSVSVGNGSNLAPGATGWIQVIQLPDFDPTVAFPEYHP